MDRLTSKRSSIDPVVTMGFSQISSTSARAFGVPNGGRGLAVALAKLDDPSGTAQGTGGLGVDDRLGQLDPGDRFAGLVRRVVNRRWSPGLGVLVPFLEAQREDDRYSE